MAAKAIDLSTAGIKVAYAIEETAGTRSELRLHHHPR